MIARMLGSKVIKETCQSSFVPGLVILYISKITITVTKITLYDQYLIANQTNRLLLQTSVQTLVLKQEKHIKVPKSLHEKFTSHWQ